MHILGIECTAHTFGVGIVTEQGKVMANAVDAFTSSDKGMIPNEIADHHREVAQRIFEKALSAAKLTKDGISLISYSAGPGLDPALWAGYHFAKALSQQWQKPLVGINHCCAHLSIRSE